MARSNESKLDRIKRELDVLLERNIKLVKEYNELAFQSNTFKGNNNWVADPELEAAARQALYVCERVEKAYEKKKGQLAKAERQILRKQGNQNV
jgi:hypothetical protein